MDRIISKPLTIVNNITGELDKYDSVLVKREQKKFTMSKRGWRKMYAAGTTHTIDELKNTKHYEVGYDGVVKTLHSDLEHDIFTCIRDSNISKSNILNFNQTDIATKLGTTRNTVAKTVRKLKETGFLRKDGVIWKMNPFIYVAANISDSDLYKLQQEWETLIARVEK